MSERPPYLIESTYRRPSERAPGAAVSHCPAVPSIPHYTACPDEAKHTKAPTSYLAWHEWAEEKAKTHEQHQCPTCGFWSIWKKKA